MHGFKAVPFVLGGALIPLCTRNVVVFVFRPEQFPAMDGLSGELTLMILHALPFAVAAHFFLLPPGSNTRRTRAHIRARKVGVVTGGAVGVVGIVAIHTSVWVHLYGPGRSSSTDVIALFLAPLWGMAVGGAGYGVGRAIAGIVFRRCELPYPPLCEKCGYSLRGLNEPRCPECGTTFRPNRPTPGPDTDDY